MFLKAMSIVVIISNIGIALEPCTMLKEDIFISLQELTALLLRPPLLSRCSVLLTRVQKKKKKSRTSGNNDFIVTTMVSA